MDLTRIYEDIIKILTECNQIQVSKGQREIFDVTYITLKESAVLQKIAECRDDFKNFIDAVYKIFYESAGADSLRVPKIFYKVSDGEVTKNVDNFIIFDIKHIRTFFDHDVQQNDNPERKEKLIADACKKHSGKTSLVMLSDKEFINFQKSILKELRCFLVNLKTEISK